MSERCEGCPLEMCEHFANEVGLMSEDPDQLTTEFSLWQTGISQHQEEIEVLLQDPEHLVNCVATDKNIDRLNELLFQEV